MSSSTASGEGADPGGRVEQWELLETRDGKVDARRVRRFAVGSQTEGCLTDDESGDLYIGEEATGIWRYSAEPDADTERARVDSIGPDGHLDPEVEGLALARGAARLLSDRLPARATARSSSTAAAKTTST